jgi:hypothetical protein
MAYFLKDRPEGLPMPEHKSPSKSKTAQQQSPRRPHYNTRHNSNSNQLSQSVTKMVAPRLKLVDGKVVLDESAASSTVTREQLTAGMQVVQEDPNRHFTSATYSKRRSASSNRWSMKETDLFYEALSMCGTDFSMIATLFPHRDRNQIKGKFKIEERNAPHRISSAIASQKKLDVTGFASKLAKVIGNNTDPSKKS